jgi:ribosomal protein S18 acetylase RimI-like enzyme
MAITYREFLPADAEQIKDLLVELAEYLYPISQCRYSHPKPEYRDSYYGRLVDTYNKGLGTIFVAIDDGKIIGFTQGEVKVQSKEELLEFKPIVEGYMRDIYVRDEYRGQGIGEVLLGMLENFLKEKGCTQYELFVFATNPAYNFYKKNGFKDQVYNMIKAL